MAEAKLYRNWRNQVTVAYPCLHCGDELRSPVEDIDSKQECPTCHTTFKVPGRDLVEAEKEAEAKRDAIRAKEKRDAERRVQKLKEDTRAKAELVAKEAAAVPVAYASPQLKTCPICGSTQPPVKKQKGSSLLAIFLLLLWIVPGLIYMSVMAGYVFVCPNCGFKYGDAR